jgi:hypothetical protein
MNSYYIPVDDLATQNDVKMRLIEFIESSEILSFGIETEVKVGFDDDGNWGKYDSGVRNVSIRLRQKGE